MEISSPRACSHPTPQGDNPSSTPLCHKCHHPEIPSQGTRDVPITSPPAQPHSRTPKSYSCPAPPGPSSSGPPVHPLYRTPRVLPSSWPLGRLSPAPPARAAPGAGGTFAAAPPPDRVGAEDAAEGGADPGQVRQVGTGQRAEDLHQELRGQLQ